MECSNEQNFPIIYQYPARVVDVEADPSEDLSCALLREVRAILVQKCLWSGRPELFLIFANILIKVSVQKRKNGTYHCSIASHVGIMLHMMP
jgi:hypothetical protein